jgi:hypothetical protein
MSLRAPIPVQVKLGHRSERGVFVREGSPPGMHGVPAIGTLVGPATVLLRPMLPADAPRFQQFIHLLRRDDVGGRAPAAGDGNGLALSRIEQLTESILRFDGSDGEHREPQLAALYIPATSRVSLMHGAHLPAQLGLIHLEKRAGEHCACA